jgi:hypothetical protein
MLLLLAIPVVVGLVFAHRLFRTVAPSNLLVARVRRSRPKVRTTVGLAALAMLLVLATHELSAVIDQGGPVWLNLIVLVLLWDAIKIALLSGAPSGPGAGAPAAHRRWPGDSVEEARPQRDTASSRPADAAAAGTVTLSGCAGALGRVSARARLGAQRAADLEPGRAAAPGQQLAA